MNTEFVSRTSEPVPLLAQGADIAILDKVETESSLRGSNNAFTRQQSQSVRHPTVQREIAMVDPTIFPLKQFDLDRRVQHRKQLEGVPFHDIQPEFSLRELMPMFDGTTNDPRYQSIATRQFTQVERHN